MRTQKRRINPKWFSVFLPMVATLASGAKANPQAITIDVRHESAPVSPLEYGMFIEPIGGLIARTLWAEMLDDRKFFFPIVPEAKDVPPPPNVEGRPGVSYRKWRPIGGNDTVAMDSDHPFVGEHSPRVSVDASVPRGLGQSGIAVSGARLYRGHAWLSGDSSVTVQLSFCSTPPTEECQRISFAVTPAWRSYDFEFTPDADAANARFEITGLGHGQFRVGAVSLMPADNLSGWRADSVKALADLHSGLWRLPGGNFLSNWDWHSALGPRDRRAPMFDYAWSAMQPNDLGMDEYMELTRLLGVEPYVTVNTGLGDANSAAEEVQYLNGAPDSEWGAKRAINGHRASYGAKYWNIGNEPYGWWQIGRTTLDYFMIKHREFARAMRAEDPSITLIGSGAMPDQLHPRDAKENPSLESIQPKFGTEEDWTGGLVAQAFGYFDGISEHWYDRAEQRPEAPRDEEFLEFVRSPSNQVRMKADEWAIYESRFPELRNRHIFLAIDEYAYIGAPASLKLSLSYAMVLNEMLRHTDFINIGAFTTGASLLDMSPGHVTLNSTGELFKFYGEHFGTGTIPIEVSGHSPQPEPKYPKGYDHPRVLAGSPTYPLDLIAGLTPDRKALLLAVVNATFSAQTMNIDLKRARVSGRGRAWRLSGETNEAPNKLGKPPGVTVQALMVPAAGSIAVAPLSVAIYELPVERRP
jgi:alpha-L-arabinofuranosidase